MTKDITLPPLRKTFIGIYFITFQRKREDALDSGWIPKEGNFDDTFPGKAIGGSVYYNRNGHIPSASGRVWYEADINYSDFSGGFSCLEKKLTARQFFYVNLEIAVEVFRNLLFTCKNA